MKNRNIVKREWDKVEFRFTIIYALLLISDEAKIKAYLELI